MAKKADASRATTDWGTPDPRDKDAYPSPSAATPMTQWAWEFLRRRFDYRACWEKIVRPFLTEDGDLDEKLIKQHHNEIFREAMQQRRSVKWQEPGNALRAEFRLLAHSNLDPRRQDPPRFEGSTVVFIEEDLLSRPPLSLVQLRELVEQIPEPPVKRTEYLLRVDLTLPIDVQWVQARSVLLELQKKRFGDINVKPRVEKFPLYLRLLDFEGRGATDAEIGRYLFPHRSDTALRDQIRKNLEAAQRWQQNYLAIALHVPAPS
jgi:hypothetical protein